MPENSAAARLQRVIDVSMSVAGIGRLEIRRIDMTRLPLRKALTDPDIRQAPEHWAVDAEHVDPARSAIVTAYDSEVVGPA